MKRFYSAWIKKLILDNHAKSQECNGAHNLSLLFISGIRIVATSDILSKFSGFGTCNDLKQAVACEQVMIRDGFAETFIVAE